MAFRISDSGIISSNKVTFCCEHAFKYAMFHSVINDLFEPKYNNWFTNLYPPNSNSIVSTTWWYSLTSKYLKMINKIKSLIHVFLYYLLRCVSAEIKLRINRFTMNELFPFASPKLIHIDIRLCTTRHNALFKPKHYINLIIIEDTYNFFFENGHLQRNDYFNSNLIPVSIIY